jgi:hypothetical protein
MTAKRAMHYLVRPLLVLLAIVFLFEAWLWRQLQPIVGWVVDRIAWRELRAKVASWIEQLPPPAALLVFLVPITLLLPVKFLGIWMLAHGHWLGALATLALAKVISMGVTAFIFEMTRPKLLQMAWFRAVYERMIVWLDWAHRLVDPIKLRIKSYLRLFSPRRAGRTMRLFWRIRRRIRAHPV